MPETLFKERGFAFSVEVHDSDGELVVLPGNNQFCVALFTVDEAPKLLRLNIVGKKILRGTICAQMAGDGTVAFTNVVVNEVSSHYFKEAFHLIVYSLAARDVKPLVLENLKVRARTIVSSSIQ